MKPILQPSSSLLSLLWIALILGFAGMGDDLGAQEEDLNRALQDHKRRAEGIAALANRFKNLVYEYIPGLEAEKSDEEKAKEAAANQATAAKVEVREVKLVMSDKSRSAASSSAVAAVDSAVERAAMEATLYRRTLQAAAAKLKIQGSFPKSKQIMIGAKNLGIGDQIAIQFKEDFFELEILDVTSSELKLKDQKSQLELNVEIGVTQALPPGMSRSRPPGMFPTEAKPLADGR